MPCTPHLIQGPQSNVLTVGSVIELSHAHSGPYPSTPPSRLVALPLAPSSLIANRAPCHTSTLAHTTELEGAAGHLQRDPGPQRHPKPEEGAA